MLANLQISPEAGSLEPKVHLPGTARYALLDFIAEELPRWRDHPDRTPETAEAALTDQLCDHLNSAARTAAGWNRVQFRTEIPDKTEGRRTIDLAAKPSGAVLIIQGRQYTQFNIILPIECKRLPTPKEQGRDEREYVATPVGPKGGMRGGIQRFKFGHHGARHCVAGMIAYVQEQPPAYWLDRVNGWIGDLARESNSGWSAQDALRTPEDDPVAGVRRLRSRHERQGKLEEIEIRHLWINMH
uniref:Uncharacterized protein n=1 Tax=Candidatus Kentrum sp. FW TaxID=2126338 RepID=A0A450TPP4_9GAMM|nr:MAG: hypothetical protein BECKFW1821C_GA0114237_102037 [Candidatus Kentron sp. FW]